MFVVGSCCFSAGFNDDDDDAQVSVVDFRTKITIRAAQADEASETTTTTQRTHIRPDTRTTTTTTTACSQVARRKIDASRVADPSQPQVACQVDFGVASHSAVAGTHNGSMQLVAVVVVGLTRSN